MLRLNHPIGTWTPLAGLAAAGLLALPAPAPAERPGPTPSEDDGTVTLVETFDENMGPWSAFGFIPCYVFQGADDCWLFEWTAVRSTEHAHRGEWSVDITANGTHDDGAVALMRPILLQPGTWEIDVSFMMYDEFDSDVNNWIVIAHIGLEQPVFQSDFAWLGEAGEAGWTEHTHSQTLTVDEPTVAYVGVGYKIVWETWRTHWFDSITISGIPPQPEHAVGDINHDGAVNVDDLLILLANWGQCPQFTEQQHDGDLPTANNHCVGDLVGDGEVGVDDILLLLSNWGQ